MFVWQALVYKKNRWIIWCPKEYCLESNDNI